MTISPLFCLSIKYRHKFECVGKKNNMRPNSFVTGKKKTTTKSAYTLDG